MSNKLVIVARVLLLLGASALAGLGTLLAFRDGSASAAEQPYVCPMHPEVRAAQPAECPICRMELERVDDSKAESPLTKPPPDTRKVALRPDSDPQYAPGVLWLPATFPPAPSATPAHGPALRAVERRTFTDRVRAAAWLEAPNQVSALLYREELVGLSPGETGTFYRSTAPLVPAPARLSDEPPSAWDASTVLVRFVLEDGKTDGSIGQVGWLELPAKSRDLLVFPQNALLRSQSGPYVLVPNQDGHFVRRPVAIGRVLRGQVVVLSGLQEGESVVVGNAFFLDAEAK